jgi:hypothetical protein
MHWEVLIVPLIALGVWILGTLFKTEDNAKQQQQRRPGTRPPGGMRPPVTDLDRFLADARQRRQESDGGRLPTPAAPVRGAPPRPTPPPPRADGQRARSRPATAPSRPARKQPTFTGPVPVEVLPDPVRVAPAAPEVPVEVVPFAKTPPAAPARPKVQQPTSPVVAQVLNLLRSPQSAGAAFVLREILGAPLSKRPGGPGRSGLPFAR